MLGEKGGIEYFRQVVEEMVVEGGYFMFNQFVNFDNWGVYYYIIGLEIWRDIKEQVIYFVFSMGMIGIIMGIFCFLKEQNLDIQIVGVQLIDGFSILGIC